MRAVIIYLFVPSANLLFCLENKASLLMQEPSRQLWTHYNPNVPSRNENLSNNRQWWSTISQHWRNFNYLRMSQYFMQSSWDIARSPRNMKKIRVMAFLVIAYHCIQFHTPCTNLLIYPFGNEAPAKRKLWFLRDSFWRNNKIALHEAKKTQWCEALVKMTCNIISTFQCR